MGQNFLLLISNLAGAFLTATIDQDDRRASQ
jgi:hypothetical protein